MFMLRINHSELFEEIGKKVACIYCKWLHRFTTFGALTVALIEYACASQPNYFIIIIFIARQRLFLHF